MMSGESKGVTRLSVALERKRKIINLPRTHAGDDRRALRRRDTNRLSNLLLQHSGAEIHRSCRGVGVLWIHASSSLAHVPTAQGRTDETLALRWNLTTVC